MSAASARGLFRATGHKSKPVCVRLLDGSYSKSEGTARARDDFYPTPAEPTRSFLAAELGRLKQFRCIWEPAAGDGAMVREMRALGFEVCASDLIDRGAGVEIRSFYDFTPATMPYGCAIVTNPPYQECGWGTPALHARGLGKARWIYHALDTLGINYMALLLNWTFPGAGGLRSLWAKYPPSRVYLMRWKIDFTGQGAPPMLNAWFVWDRRYRGETVLRMLDRADARQAELFSLNGIAQDLFSQPHDPQTGEIFEEDEHDEPEDDASEFAEDFDADRDMPAFLRRNGSAP